MKSRKVKTALFILLALAQLAVPAKMILEQESIREEGVLHRLRLQPRDPVNPFSGRYLRLNFEATRLKILPDADEVFANQSIYVKLEQDDEGFSVPVSYFTEATEADPGYLAVKVDYVYKEEILIEYPFDKYFMEESKAIKADLHIFEILNNPENLVYAEVYVKDGLATLAAVKVNDLSIEEHLNAMAAEPAGNTP